MGHNNDFLLLFPTFFMLLLKSEHVSHLTLTCVNGKNFIKMWAHVHSFLLTEVYLESCRVIWADLCSFKPILSSFRVIEHIWGQLSSLRPISAYLADLSSHRLFQHFQKIYWIFLLESNHQKLLHLYLQD